MARISSRKRITQPARRAPTTFDRLESAYQTLGITAKQVNSSPRITHILSKLPGGIKRAIEFLRGADNDEARKWLSLYDDMPASIRKLVPFEAFCLASGLTTKRMLELVTGACFEQSHAADELLAAASHTDVVRATVVSALTLDGHQDRKMLHLHAKFLPIPKSQTTFIAPGGIQNNAQITDNSTKVSYTVGEITGIERRQERIADRFNERLGLGSGRPASETLRYLGETNEPEPETIDAEAATIEPKTETPATLDTSDMTDADWDT